TEVFFFPAAQVAETEGTFTNTQRMLQWHFKAAEAPGDCRTDVWFTYQLGKRLKKLYADSQAPRDQGFKNLTFDYEHENARERETWVWWDGAKWTGYDVPDFAATKAPTAKATPGSIGLDALSGTQPFIMKPDGVGWLYVPTGLVDGPLPTQYEPVESPVHNP